ncbi:protein N-lysine methyltransferase METTL21D [Rhodamnia argentea]|uniref:Protein N-lysine methyltransferase METTL21D n=1 Tax=Rhodamnia argentea TaxID=178133 RepID=A0A8B8P3K9_9MYRT|nr:protein N-lysine methyltransferase METTL21D [Rhodamnia argentea]
MNSDEVAAHDDDEDDNIDPLAILLPPPEDDGDGEEGNPAQPNQLEHHHLRSVNATIAIRQLPSQGLSFQLWPAATTLLNLLDSHISDPAAGPLSPILADRRCPGQRRLSILELGSGTGLVGIAAAVALGADVTVTDLPHVVPNLQFSVDANAAALAAGSGGGGAVRVAALRWGKAEDVRALGEEYDVILASDVVYYDHLYDPLVETLRWLFEGSDRREEMVFVMAHLRRWKKDSAFFRKARKAFDVEVIHMDEPRGGSRIGVVVYRFDWKRKRAAKCATPSDTVSSDLTKHSV